MTRQLVRSAIAVLVTFLGLGILWQFRITVLYFLISLAVAAVVRPLVKHLSMQGRLARLALILLVLVVLGSLGFLFFLVGELVVSEVKQLSLGMSAQDQWTLPAWTVSSSFFQTLTSQFPPPSVLLASLTGEQGQLVLPTVLGFTQDITGVVSGVFVVLFMSIYWSINQIHFERLWLSLLPSGQRKRARGVWRTVEPDLGAYIRSQILLSLLAGVLLGLGYWVMGSPYPASLALTGALACLIPLVGPPLALIPPFLIGMLTSVPLSLFTTLYTFIIFLILVVWVKPHLFYHRVDNPILTVVLLFALSDAFGILGIIVAPPLSAAIQILWNQLVSNRSVAGAADQISDLKARQTLLWAAIKSMDEPPLPLVTSSMERLSILIEKAEPILQVALPAESSELALHSASQPEQEVLNGRAQNS